MATTKRAESKPKSVESKPSFEDRLTALEEGMSLAAASHLELKARADTSNERLEKIGSNVERLMHLMEGNIQRTSALEARSLKLEARADNVDHWIDEEVGPAASGHTGDGNGRTSSAAGGAARRPLNRRTSTTEGAARRPSARSLNSGGSRDSGQEGGPGAPSPTPSGSRRELEFDNLSESEFFESGDVKLKLRNFDGRKKHEWWRWRNDALSIAEMNGFGSAFVREEPIKCMPFNIRELLEQGVPPKDIRKAKKAWCLLVTHITDDSMKDMIYSAGSPSAAWKQLNEWMEPETPGVELGLFQQFMSVDMSRGGDPLDLYAKLKSVASKMSALIRNPPVSEYIEGRLTNLRFLSALPSEYDTCVERLRTEVSGTAFSLKHIQEVVGDRYKSLQQSGKAGQGAKALFAGSGNPGRGRGRGGRSGRGARGARGRGGKSGQQSGVEASADGASNPSSAATAPTSTAPTAAAAAAPAPVSAPAQDVKRCHVCNATNHFMNNCPKRVCSTCGGKGHSADQCPTHTGVLAAVEPESTDYVLMALDPSDGNPGEECSGQGYQLSETWVGDTGATVHMTSSKLGMYNFEPTVSRMTTASGDTFMSEGFGSLDIEITLQGVPGTL